MARRLVRIYLCSVVFSPSCKATSTTELLNVEFTDRPTVTWLSPKPGADGTPLNGDILFATSMPLDVQSLQRQAILKNTGTGAVLTFIVRSTGSNGYQIIPDQQFVAKNYYSFMIPTSTKTLGREFAADQVLNFSTLATLQPVASSFGAATDGVGTFVLPEGTSTHAASITFAKPVNGVTLATDSVEITAAAGCMNCLSLTGLTGSGTGPYQFQINGLLSMGVYTLKFGKQIRDIDGNSASSQITFSVAPVVSNVRNMGSRGTSGGWANIPVGPQITIDPAGNTYVAGLFTGSTNWGGGARTVPNKGMYVIQYNAAGAYVWDRYWNFSDFMITGILSDASGVYIGGSASSGVTFDPGVTIGNSGGNDIFSVKLDSSGAAIWANRINNGATHDVSRIFRWDAYGNLLVSGDSSSSFPGTAFSGPIATGCGTPTGQQMLVSLNPTTGNCRWFIPINGASLYLNDIAADTSYLYLVGTYVAAGAAYLTGAAGLQIGSATLGGGDIFVARIGANSGNTPDTSVGAGRWISRFGATTDEGPRSLAIDAGTNRIYVVGTINGSANLGCTPACTVGSGGTNDGFIAALDMTSGGAPLWAQTIGGTFGFDESQRVLVANGRARVFTQYDLGISNLKVNQFGCILNSFSGFGLKDMLITMYDASGNLIGARFFGSPYNEEFSGGFGNNTFVHQDTGTGRLTIGVNMGPGNIDTTTISGSANPFDAVQWQMQ